MEILACSLMQIPRPNFSSQAPQIWNFSVHKDPLSEAKTRGQKPVRKPTLRKSGRTPLPEKKEEKKKEV